MFHSFSGRCHNARCHVHALDGRVEFRIAAATVDFPSVTAQRHCPYHANPVRHRSEPRRFLATPGDALEWMFPLGDLDEAGYPRFFQDLSAEAMPVFQGFEEITGRGC